ncbi:hypothetical protein AVEN_14266-1 [Araneus ventricosus]|uniref:Uncharacterized protein n=1 Tax=Araneus ventricosus TaxID=182803 RepID=A0A4Y2KCM8_ARAVE|nr:hypothetical protein AVEN_14266-1 [Araneus ventricosus]
MLRITEESFTDAFWNVPSPTNSLTIRWVEEEVLQMLYWNSPIIPPILDYTVGRPTVGWEEESFTDAVLEQSHQSTNSLTIRLGRRKSFTDAVAVPSSTNSRLYSWVAGRVLQMLYWNCPIIPPIVDYTVGAGKGTDSCTGTVPSSHCSRLYSCSRTESFTDALPGIIHQ